MTRSDIHAELLRLRTWRTVYEAHGDAEVDARIRHLESLLYPAETRKAA